MSDLVRVPYDGRTYVRLTDTLILSKRGGGERRVPPGKWWVNRNTPIGEDADLWERKPHNGRRYVPWKQLIAIERHTQEPVTTEFADFTD